MRQYADEMQTELGRSGDRPRLASGDAPTAHQGGARRVDGVKRGRSLRQPIDH